jgi:hypothetical protein
MKALDMQRGFSRFRRFLIVLGILFSAAWLGIIVWLSFDDFTTPKANHDDIFIFGNLNMRANAIQRLVLKKGNVESRANDIMFNLNDWAMGQAPISAIKRSSDTGRIIERLQSYDTSATNSNFIIDSLDRQESFRKDVMDAGDDNHSESKFHAFLSFLDFRNQTNIPLEEVRYNCKELYQIVQATFWKEGDDGKVAPITAYYFYGDVDHIESAASRRLICLGFWSLVYFIPVFTYFAFAATLRWILEGFFPLAREQRAPLVQVQ